MSRYTHLTLPELEAEEAALQVALQVAGRKKPHPFGALKDAIHADPDYAWGWLCNLAVPIMDVTSCTHEYANQAAALIMAQMFDYDATALPHYQGGKSGHQHYFEARVAAERNEDRTAALETLMAIDGPMYGEAGDAA